MPLSLPIEKAQARYKRNFDRTVLPVNRDLTARDQAFLDILGTPAEQTLLGRRRTKLDWKTVRPYTVLANDGPTIVPDIDLLPERINSNPDPFRTCRLARLAVGKPRCLPAVEPGCDTSHRHGCG